MKALCWSSDSDHFNRGDVVEVVGFVYAMHQLQVVVLDRHQRFVNDVAWRYMKVADDVTPAQLEDAAFARSSDAIRDRDARKAHRS